MKDSYDCDSYDYAGRPGSKILPTRRATGGSMLQQFEAGRKDDEPGGQPKSACWIRGSRGYTQGEIRAEMVSVFEEVDVNILI